MITTIETSVVSVSPDVMSGAAVFTGTRVPVQSLLDYLAAGHSLEEFLVDFPTVPRRLKHELPDHSVRSVPEAGWAGKQNGELLGLAEIEFDVLITNDRNMEHQQILARFDLAFIVLSAPTNDIDDLRPLMPEAREALKTIRAGQIVYVGP